MKWHLPRDSPDVHDSSRKRKQLEALREWLVGISHLQVRLLWEIHGEFMPDLQLPTHRVEGNSHPLNVFSMLAAEPGPTLSIYL